MRKKVRLPGIIGLFILVVLFLLPATTLAGYSPRTPPETATVSTTPRTPRPTATTTVETPPPTETTPSPTATPTPFTPTPTPADEGEGCTPGYWKQSQHFDSWVGYSPSDSFEGVFGVTADLLSGSTLLDALQAGGGGEEALGRHAVAALLNSTSPDVGYAFSTAEVIAKVQFAYTTGDFEVIKDQFEAENERLCPLS